MAAARYWRLTGVEAYAQGDFEVSEIALYSGASRVDGSATISASHAPRTGALTHLQDANVATSCCFGGEAVRSSGFFIKWDFGSPINISALKLAASNSLARFGFSGQMSSSSDGAAWVVVGEWRGALYPGDFQYTNAVAVATAAWSVTDKHPSVALSPDRLGATGPGVATYVNVRCDTGVDAGALYWELYGTNLSGGAIVSGVGIATASASLGGSVYSYIGGDSAGLAYYNNDGGVYRSAAAVGSGVFTPYASNDVIGVALDRDAGNLRLYKNGLLIWTISSLPGGTLYPAASLYGGASVGGNFGGSAFAFAPPAGHAGFVGALALPSVGIFGPRTVAPRSLLSAASAPVPSHTTHTLRSLQLARDVEFGGPGTIYGTTKTAGAQGAPSTPTKARVVLLHQRSKLPVRETWSDPVTGNYAFVGIDTSQQFLVLAEDAQGNFRPVAANRLTPEVQP